MKKGKSKAPAIAVIVAVIALIGIIGSTGDDNAEETNESYPLFSDTAPDLEGSKSSPAESDEPEDPGMTMYKEGQYKVGSDLPEGAYVLVCTGSSAYFAYSTDANGDDIIENDNFEGHSIVDVQSGEYLEIKRCYAVPLDEVPGFDPADGYLPEGCYIAGKHIAAGEYKVEMNPDANYAAYVCVYSDARRTDIVTNDNFDGSRYITVEDGQMLVIKRASVKITP